MSDLGINVGERVSVGEQVGQSEPIVLEGEELALLHNGEIVRRVTLEKPVRLKANMVVKLGWTLSAEIKK